MVPARGGGWDVHHDQGLSPAGGVHALDRGLVRPGRRGADHERGGAHRGGARSRGHRCVAGGGIHEAASTEAPLWDAGKLAAMQGRVLAESVRSEGYAPLWDEGKLEAMKGRVLAESPGSGIPLCSGTRAGSRPWKVVFWPGSSRFEPAGRVQVHEWPGGTERAGRLGFCNRARTAVLRILASTDAGKVR